MIKKILAELIIQIRGFVYQILAVLNTPFLPKQHLIVLCYHGFGKDNWRFTSKISDFKKQIKYLLQDYQPITAEDLTDYIQKGKQLPPKCFLITIDDGYKEVTKLINFLSVKNIKPLLFVLSEPGNANRFQLQNNRPLLNFSQIRDLKKAGWSIGCHSATHTNLSVLNTKQLNIEIQDAKKSLEKSLRLKVKYFAYPNGNYNHKILRITKKAGFNLAFSMDDIIINKNINPLAIPRIGVDNTHSFPEFKTLYLPFTIQFRAFFKCYFNKLLSVYLHLSNKIPSSEEKIIVIKKKENIVSGKKIAQTNFLIIGLSFLVIALVLIFCLRGLPGNPNANELITNKWQLSGPFELSPERGRFALTYSLVEDKSFYFSNEIARFATPDLGTINNKFVSLFAPGVSFIIAPGYLIGKMFNLSQVGAFAVIGIFAFLNSYLIFRIAKKLGASPVASAASAFTFMLATPALTYGSTLYQHHISTFTLLLSVLLLINFDTFLSLTVIAFLLATSISIDYPNFFMCLPIAFFAIKKIVFMKHKSAGLLKQKISVIIRPFQSLAIIGVVLPVFFFLWFNYSSYGNPYQLAGTVPSIQALDASGKQVAPKITGAEEQKVLNPELQKKSAVGFFHTRNLLNGFYIYSFSPDRGIIFFTPIVILGLIGFFVLYKINSQICALLLGIIGVNVLLYSMWEDPWGGWAFGARYLIPSYAMASIGLAFILSRFSGKFILLLTFFILVNYGMAVNILGAITSSSNPPQIEILQIENITRQQERFSIDRNLNYLMTKGSKSFLYQSEVTKVLTPFAFYIALLALASFSSIILTLGIRGEKGINK